ncbi:ketoacyl-ACP synthase III [Frigoribacterium sp. NBH87]|uniref:3-oxoacyl-ACP synthase III family protein n=1 Tax=Frigoribacterium sp. NBH87 TaxID=2596916 RepID=UPI0016252DC2|nr:ketoacyl-ACP synthase III [Frigoribacterium sp. NBH87]QNE44172.1 ketoacyl-ACP synthase III [Frigoribacterium sp. NBH87]
MTAPVHAQLAALSSYLPEAVLTDDDLAAQHPGWDVARAAASTGVHARHVAAPGEWTSHLAASAVRRLLAERDLDPASVDALIVCTQSPDLVLPATACLVQERAGLGSHVAALDVSLGCSGWVYGLALARGLVETRQAERVVLVTADALTRLVNPGDPQLRVLFGDAATAALVTGGAEGPRFLGATFGTDGRGARHLLAVNGGLAPGEERAPGSSPEARGLTPSGRDVYMDGPEVFAFTLRTVPGALDTCLRRAGLTVDDVDLFVFHQANAVMLESLRRRIGLPPEKFVVDLATTGNTASSSVPLALQAAVRAGRAGPGDRVALVGFGIGYSWAAVVVQL